jgi:DNA-binding NtrC family response regulator
MASILLIGGDEALLEGLAQMLAHAGHVPHTAHSVNDAIEVAAGTRPLVAIVDRNIALANPEIARLPLDSGGSFLIYHSGESTRPPLAGGLQRLVLAELDLPLERNRLLALVQRVDERTRAAGRRVNESTDYRAR